MNLKTDISGIITYNNRPISRIFLYRNNTLFKNHKKEYQYLIHLFNYFLDEKTVKRPSTDRIIQFLHEYYDFTNNIDERIILEDLIYIFTIIEKEEKTK